jgi:hypothetical protein
VKIWTEIVKTDEALLKLGKTADEAPIKDKYCTILVVEPVDKSDHDLVDLFRRAFFDATLMAKGKCGIFTVDNGNSKQYIFLMANSRTDLEGWSPIKKTASS